MNKQYIEPMIEVMVLGSTAALCQSSGVGGGSSAINQETGQGGSQGGGRSPRRAVF